MEFLATHPSPLSAQNEPCSKELCFRALQRKVGAEQALKGAGKQMAASYSHVGTWG